jgi:hypothetical protein
VTCQSTWFERILVVRWQEPELSDLAAIDAAVRQRVQAQTAGARVIYIAVIPVESAPPTEEVRTAMMQNMAEMARACESVHVVIEGKGLKYTALRSLTAGMFLVAGARNMHMHETVDGALQKTTLTQAEIDDVLARAAAQSLLTRD